MMDVGPFLDDVAANPHDDTPRLVLADWIEENGDEALRPFGEFIRVQYALEGMHPGNPRRPGLLRLQEALLPAQLERWREALARFRGAPHFRRGFVEGARLAAGQLSKLSEGNGFGLPLRSLALRGECDARAAGASILAQIEELVEAYLGEQGMAG